MYILKIENILPMQTIPLGQIWPEDTVFAIIANVHIYNMFKSVYERSLDCFHEKCSDTDKRKSLSGTSLGDSQS